MQRSAPNSSSLSSSQGVQGSSFVHTGPCLSRKEQKQRRISIEALSAGWTSVAGNNGLVRTLLYSRGPSAHKSTPAASKDGHKRARVGILHLPKRSDAYLFTVYILPASCVLHARGCFVVLIDRATGPIVLYPRFFRFISNLAPVQAGRWACEFWNISVCDNEASRGNVDRSPRLKCKTK